MVSSLPAQEGTKCERLRHPPAPSAGRGLTPLPGANFSIMGLLLEAPNAGCPPAFREKTSYLKLNFAQKCVPSARVNCSRRNPRKAKSSSLRWCSFPGRVNFAVGLRQEVVQLLGLVTLKITADHRWADLAPTGTERR